MYMLLALFMVNIITCALLGLNGGEAAIWKIAPEKMIML